MVKMKVPAAVHHHDVPLTTRKPQKPLNQQLLHLQVMHQYKAGITKSVVKTIPQESKNCAMCCHCLMLRPSCCVLCLMIFGVVGGGAG
jgi:hypothetical protein